MPFETVRAMGTALPDVCAGTAYGSPAIKLRGTLLACMATHRSSEPHTLIVSVDFLTRDLLIAKNPAIYYVKPHYLSYPSVLVRLARIGPSELKEVLEMGWRYVSTKTKPRGRRAGASRTGTRRVTKRRTVSGKT
jgi:hypothetical protein